MKFKNSSFFRHDQQDRIGVLITNLGTPEAPTAKALRTYLKEFLSDSRVVEIPRIIWWCILNLIILRIRPAKSAEAYQSVWTDQGSPLLFHTRNQAQALQTLMQEHGHDNVIVEFAMRYGYPSLSDTMQKMFEQGVRKLLVLPLYPQYSATTTASTYDQISRDFMRRRWLPDFRFISHYHDHPDFIEAAAARIREHWQQHGRADRLVLSYHGIPKRNLLEGDPYHCECHKTSRLIAQALDVPSDTIITTFQSRFGKQEWLKPYTDETLKSLPGEGIKSVQIFCPGFPADCLETIEEIGEENREYFMHAGGERYEYISALNDRPDHIRALYSIVKDNLGGWDTEPSAALRARLAEDMQAAKQ